MRPGPPRTTLVGTWLAAVVVFGALLLVARAAREPLDDRDLAYQRPGLLDVGPLPVPAPSIRDLDYAGGPTVVAFARAVGVTSVCRSLAGRSDPLPAEVVVVVAPGPPSASPPPTTCPAPAGRNPVRVVPADSVASFGIGPTRDGGPPVGYAIVDRNGLIRYRTLDPTYTERWAEVETVLGSLP